MTVHHYLHPLNIHVHVPETMSIALDQFPVGDQKAGLRMHPLDLVVVVPQQEGGSFGMKMWVEGADRWHPALLRDP